MASRTDAKTGSSRAGRARFGLARPCAGFFGLARGWDCRSVLLRSNVPRRLVGLSSASGRRSWSRASTSTWSLAYRSPSGHPHRTLFPGTRIRQGLSSTGARRASSHGSHPQPQPDHDLATVGVGARAQRRPPLDLVDRPLLPRRTRFLPARLPARPCHRGRATARRRSRQMKRCRGPRRRCGEHPCRVVARIDRRRGRPGLRNARTLSLLQLNSIAAGADLAGSTSRRLVAAPSARRPGHRNWVCLRISARGVVFSGATREPVLSRPVAAGTDEPALRAPCPGRALGRRQRLRRPRALRSDQFATVTRLPGLDPRPLHGRRLLPSGERLG